MAKRSRAQQSQGKSKPAAKPRSRGTAQGKSPIDDNDDATDIDLRKVCRSAVLSDAFEVSNEARRKRLGLPDPNDESHEVPMMIELNLFHSQGLSGSTTGFLELFRKKFPKKPQPVPVANTYYRCKLTLKQAEDLVDADEDRERKLKKEKQRCIYRIWPDFKLRRMVDRSVATIKADAARRSYDAAGDGITWAVIDSGIDGNHPHFQGYNTLGDDVAELHRDFTLADDGKSKTALMDEEGHGTHVAGIIAGGLCGWNSGSSLRGRNDELEKLEVRVGQRANMDVIDRRTPSDLTRLSGVAPRTKLVSLKVIGNGEDSSSNVMRALQYIREQVNGDGKIMRIHGVNLSVGYEFDAKWFACGQSPICVEVDRLVRSGVVVVVAAGNTGYGDLTSREGITSTGLALTINDPGNAGLAITVGATHRDSPHTYGVSYFSSKGPTGDGRLKPDLVAPGERITSCAAGRLAEEMKQSKAAKRLPRNKKVALYLDDSGTSMAAPHVSGAIAAFLSIRREFIGRPDEVKRIFLQTATTLGRERYFEGHGLVDLMRAIQSV